MIIRDWTWDQWKAVGRHGLTAVSAIIGTLVFSDLINANNAQDLAKDVNIIVDSVGKIATAIAGIVAILAPVYAGLRAASSAKPENQAKAVVKALDQGLPLNGKRNELINAIANQPDVKKVEMVDKTIADAIPSEKVT
jgi:hypothetical protein